MAVIRMMISILFLSSVVSVTAMFKKGSKQLVEDHLDGQLPVDTQVGEKGPANGGDMAFKQKQDFPSLPPLGDIGNIVNNVKNTINKTINAGKEAVEDAKDVALNVLEAGAHRVNETLDALGSEILEANSTAAGLIKEVQAKIRMAENKALAFAKAAQDLLKAVMPQFEKLQGGLHNAIGVADDALAAMGQKPAGKKLDEAMSPVFATVESWSISVNDVLKTLTAYADEQEENGAVVGSNASNASNASLLQLDPEQMLADALREPLSGLKMAAGQLHSLANKTFDAMNNFVDAGLDAAAGKLPNDLITNVSDILEGVQEKARAQLEPLGSVGDEIVDGLYSTAKVAGVSVERSNARGSGLMIVSLACALLATF